MSFSEELKKERKKRNINRKEMAELLKIPYRTYQNWELGIRKPLELMQVYVLDIIKKI